MKSKLYLLLIIFLFSGNLLAEGWVTYPSGTRSTLFGVSMSKINPAYGYAVGEAGLILATFDGGYSWWTSNYNIGYWLQSVSAVDKNTAFAVGFDPANGWAKILRTTTGGSYWDHLWGDAYNILNSVSFGDNMHGTAVGRAGIVIRTTDGGVNWTPQVAAPYDLQSVCFINVNTGWIVGALGTIRKTTNGGTNWFNQSSPDTNKLFGVSFYNEFYGSAVGADGEIIVSSDGGFTWDRRYCEVPVQLNAVSQTSNNNITVVGNMGTILRSNDGGNSFHLQTSAVPNISLNGVCFTSAFDGVLVGGSGSIQRTISAGGDSMDVIGIHKIGTEVPGKFVLNQNYPNPFNPSTTIRFSIPQNAFVKLKIYNILGAEISTLVNKNLKSGTYEYSWNAMNLTSGTYFYELSADNFRQTKRMLFIK